MAAVLPGEIEAGIRDLHAGHTTVAALLVAIEAPGLKRLALILAEHVPQHPEHSLYNLLAQNDEDAAHSRYNYLIRRLVSYERAAECEKSNSESLN
ncbi:MAG TPA: hypothetical protein VK208_09300 [Pyrinomonadaceae bacterium]|jgi:hypothetical protein|nr:hypothetical protein [Pyrinomonadaceae bacterium]